jgi:c-di-GMP-binding flagellar brake protein YcgR
MEQENDRTEKEKRKHIRAKSSMKIMYRIWEHLGDRSEEYEVRVSKPAVSVDISVSGMQFISDEPLPSGKLLRIDIELPDQEVPLTTFGRVEWCKKSDEKPDTYKIGVNFMLIDADHTQLIRRITGEYIK